MCEQRVRHHRSLRVNYVAYLTPSSFFLKSFSQVNEKGCVEGELPVGSQKGGSQPCLQGGSRVPQDILPPRSNHHTQDLIHLLEEMTVSLTAPCNTEFIKLS